MSITIENRRSPYGERGLKYLSCAWHAPLILSLSLRRAWIEMSAWRTSPANCRVALLTESVD